MLRYTNQTLSNDTFEFSDSVSVYANQYLNIKSSSENITDVKVFDVLGKQFLAKTKLVKTKLV
ncbi:MULTISPECIES: hypothetical protein [Flavobacterium]|uniref:T9SS type A sorting domain-containing protein n=1 Tax=Flavobacterium hankyongi TaxID=1176532 RepID=A0ABP8ZUJ1_9FLAO|nr:hypothetical protein [Flavobacterium sp. N1846]